MPNDTCSVATCERQSFCRGWCNRHYQRWYKTGDPEGLKPGRGKRVRTECVVEGCERTEVTNGWCGLHYQRWRRTGDPEWVKPQPEPEAVTCSVEGCDRAEVARGWCDRHYRRVLKNGEPGPTEISHRHKVKPPCAVDGCDTEAITRALCDRHYRRWLSTGDPGPAGTVYRRRRGQKEWAEKKPLTPEELRLRKNQRAREYYQNARQKNLARAKRYREANPEYFAAKGREWRDANPGYQSASAKAWYEANPERAREIWHQKDGRRRERMQLTFNLPIDYKALLAKYGKVCHLCRKPIDGDLTWDHVKPLARGGTHTEDNLKPAHRRCNSRKGAREGLPEHVSPRSQKRLVT